MIPYDGSKNTEIALGALRRRADLAREKHEALIVVSDVWLPESPEEFASAVAARRRKTALSGTSSHAPALRAWEEERVLSHEARRRIASMFPLWDARVEFLPGFNLVSSEILEKAESSKADLIVIGAENIFAAETNGYGAGALRVVKEARCSVLLTRETGFGGESGDWKQETPARALFIRDGTAAADADIARTAARRKWMPGSEARIISIGAKRSAVREKHLTEKLRAAGLKASPVKQESDSAAPPGAALAQAVSDWDPDCIFTGDGGGGYCVEENDSGRRRKLRREIEEILRLTKCSVEFVRNTQEKQRASGTAAGKGNIIKTRRNPMPGRQLI